VSAYGKRPLWPHAEIGLAVIVDEKVVSKCVAHSQRSVRQPPLATLGDVIIVTEIRQDIHIQLRRNLHVCF